MEKKYITPYINHRVGVVFRNVNAVLIGIDYYQSLGGFDRVQLSMTKPSVIDEVYYSYILLDSPFKLILRPISDLTKEIEYNGKRFIPLIELAKIAYPKACEDYKIKENYVDIGIRYTFHYYSKQQSFDCMQGYNGKRWDTKCFVENQLMLFEKLFEWHFDVYGMIPNNLAIDINTLKNE